MIETAAAATPLTMATARHRMNRNASSSFCAVAVFGVFGTLSACGGGSPSGSAVAVAVTPAPSPAPSPSPTPTPTVALGQRLGPPLLSVLRAGDQIAGPIICAGGTLNYAVDPDGTIRLASLSAIASTPGNDSSVAITSGGPDSYGFDLNGFGGSIFTPADKRSSILPGYLEYRRRDDQMQIANTSLGFGTVGFLANGTTGICFFAAGPGRETLAENGTINADASVADGFAVIAGRPYRLTTNDLTGTWSVRDRSIDLRMDLPPRQPAFGPANPLGPLAIGPVRLRLEARTATITIGASAEPASGTIECAFYQGGFGVGCVFQFQTAAGDRFIGSLAVDAKLI